MVTKQEQPKKRKLTRPTTAQKHRVVMRNLAENGGNLGKAIKDSGLYSPSVAETPTKITDSKTWSELIEQEMPDTLLSGVHKGLLKSTRLDHMVFPKGPRTDKEKKTIEALPEHLETILDAEMQMQETELSDEDIVEMLAEVNCIVRRIVHGETARHVYFWASDNKARKEGLDMAYKLKGRYGDEGVPPPRGNTYNFIFSAETQSKIKAIEGEIKSMLIKPHVEPS